MAGLIDVGILKPELAGSFAAGYRGAEKARQEAEQARQQSERTQQQIAQGRQQMQMDEFTLQKLREDRAALTDLQAKLRSAGQSDDPKLFFQTLINTGNPDYMNKGYEGLQRYKELQQADQVLRQFAPEMFVNAATPAKPITAMAPGALGSGTFGVMPEPINALAPKVTETPQPTNAMVAAPVADNAPDVNALRRQLFMLSSVNDPRAKAMADVIKGQITEASKPYVVGGRLVTGAGKELYTAPEKAPAPPAMVAEYTFAKTPEGGGYVGSFEKFVRDRAIAARPPGAPAQPVAPTITTIVDPTDPTKMIAIDAKRYQGGGAGSPGVIGVSGKEPGAALRENKVEAGKTQLADDLDNLRASFQKLDAMRAIPSTERNVLSNIMSATGASGVGQTLGRATGTEAQVERDVINSARQRLVTSIKNATGMSAQQLNSNVELQTMLKSISDPGQSVQAAMRIIDDIEQAYVKGNGKLPKGNVPATPPAIVPGKAGGPAVVPAKTKSGATASNW